MEALENNRWLAIAFADVDEARSARPEFLQINPPFWSDCSRGHVAFCWIGALEDLLKEAARCDQVPRLISILAHGARRKEFHEWAGGATSLDWVTCSSQVRPLFNETRASVRDAATADDLFATIEAFTDKWRATAIRDPLGYLRHRAVNVFAPLAVTIQDVTELAGLRDLTGCSVRLDEIKNDYQASANDRPMRILRTARELLFEDGTVPTVVRRKRSDPDTPRDPTEATGNFDDTMLLTVVSLSKWVVSAPETASRLASKVWLSTLEMLGGKLEGNRPGIVWDRDSWIESYCLKAETLFRFGHAKPIDLVQAVASASSTLPVTDVVATLLPPARKDFQGLSEWLAQLSRSLRVPEGVAREE